MNRKRDPSSICALEAAEGDITQALIRSPLTGHALEGRSILDSNTQKVL
jgi:hypothetical protein